MNTNTATSPRYTAVECPTKDGTWLIQDAYWGGATAIRVSADKVAETIAHLERIKS